MLDASAAPHAAGRASSRRPTRRGSRRSPRWTDELVTDSLVYRYDPAASPDGLRGSEGTFSLCTFWYVDALARAGRLDEARLTFEKMLTYANHLGLYSEEIALTGEQIGNFPQAFTHLSLINAAITLDRQLDEHGDRVGRPAPARRAATAVPDELQARTSGRPSSALRRVLVPLALAQFICSFAGSNMNVMINDISKDLDTTVQGVQIAITIFLLVMAALMIPGGKLTDRYGRKRCFTVGLVVYGIGALLSAVAPGLGVLILGNSILEGVGTALLIPPVYILTTLLFTERHLAGPGVRRDQRAWAASAPRPAR